MFTLPPPSWVSVGSIVDVVRLEVERLFESSRHVRHDFGKKRALDLCSERSKR